MRLRVSSGPMQSTCPLERDVEMRLLRCRGLLLEIVAAMLNGHADAHLGLLLSLHSWLAIPHDKAP